ncbi:hypothetical protein NpNSSI1_00005916 [Neofusicoccum parvum]|uniref:Uncharacterized protein n=1 Tax=Neofusicoccum parvum TaxID=310453 RepID=A0ACB5RQ69_9PEZI|nr:hypothetical protein NpPPO83_00002407 [Neofusicoccum parvum]GME47244.1 hypothetical protein NpNSSI1_00005916 [Neofusicoccum parvum]
MPGLAASKPVRYRRIDLTLPSISAVNQATLQSTIFFFTRRRAPKRKRSLRSASPSPTSRASRSVRATPTQRSSPASTNSRPPAPRTPSSIYSQDSGIGLSGSQGSSITLSLDEGSGYNDDNEGDGEWSLRDVDAAFDMAGETEAFLNHDFELVMQTFRMRWGRADMREKSRLCSALATLLSAFTNGLDSVHVHLLMPPSETVD